MANNNYDEYLSGILLDEKSQAGFFKAIFNFLARRTDFYYVSKDEHEHVGYPPGIAREMVLTIMNECDPNNYSKLSGLYPSNDNAHIPNIVAEEVEVISENIPEQSNNFKNLEIEDKEKEDKDKKVPIKSSKTECDQSIQRSYESYNGADREIYAWSQTIGELDVSVRLPSDINSSKNVKVVTTSETLQVAYSIDRVNWNTLIKDTFPYKVKHSETMWTMTKGNLRMSLEKQQEKWWDCLLNSEPKLDLTKINRSRLLYELPEDHISKVRELQFNHEQKLKGLPTTDDIKKTEILRKAWDLEGSPFKGTPFNPDVISK